MTATNHALTGSIIGLSVHQPILALGLALVSHYILDAIPHFGSSQPNNTVLRSKVFRNYLLVEASLCFLIVGGLAYFQPDHWPLAAVCAFVATAPDLLSINRFVKSIHGKAWRAGSYSRFAIKIQWFERPIGATVELVWAAGALVVLANLM